MKTILFIEDKPHVRENFVKLLTGQLGFFKALSSPTALAATDVMEKIHVDAVITGIHLNAKEIDLLDNQLRKFPGTKLIVMSGKKSPVADLLRTFEYAVQVDQPADANALLDVLLKEFNIDDGGQMRGIGLTSFLQMIELESKTCTLKIISCRNIGYLYCKSGELIEAEAAGVNGKPAAFQILSWEKPLICVDYGSMLKEKTIQGPLMSLLLESGCISDERQGEASEKRRYKRTACALTAEFDVNEWTYKGVICDISLGGSFIKTNEPISVGQKISLTLVSQSLGKSIAVGGKIVRRSQEGIGVEFGALSMNQRNIIRTVIEEVPVS